jgi:hypothetical protein
MPPSARTVSGDRPSSSRKSRHAATLRRLKLEIGRRRIRGRHVDLLCGDMRVPIELIEYVLS